MSALSKLEKYRFCDPSFYELLTIIMIADSKSYTCLYPNVCQNARDEFLQKNNMLIK